MGILGITNRTENWKTAQTFAPFIGNQPALRSLAGRLLSEPLDDKEEVSLELFWKGGRDYWAEHKPKLRDLVDAYDRHFDGLRGEIVEFSQRDPSKSFRPLKRRNYNVRGENERKLANHFRNTEFDIVLETSEHLFIGEAKDESGFDAKSRYVLVHQLIRQYVIAKVLVDLAKKTKCVVPFVVAPRDKLKLGRLKDNSQIRFVMKMGWLKERNILSWGESTSLPSAYQPSTE